MSTNTQPQALLEAELAGETLESELVEHLAALDPQKALTLVDLPPELQIHILAFLNCPNLLRVAQLNRYWHGLVTQTAAIQYTIELFSDGLVSLPSASPCSERLETLLERRKKWRGLDWTHSHLPQFSTACTAYELVGRVFVKLLEREFSVIRLEGDDLHLDMQILKWPARDVAIDPTSDIAIFLHIGVAHGFPLAVLKVKTLSGYSRHPDAKDDTIFYVGCESESLEGPAFMQIANDVVVLFLSGEEDLTQKRVMAWNWKTGVLLMDINPADSIYPSLQACDFGFLCPTSFLLAEQVNPGRFVLFTFDPLYPGPPRRSASLLLPPIHPDISITDFTVHSNALLRRRIQGRNLPFKADPDARIHVIMLSYSSSNENEPPFSMMMVVHHDAFRKYLQPHSSTDEVREIPWSEWGPKHTRIISASGHFYVPPFRWLRYVHGTKLALPSHSMIRSPDDPDYIKLLDFSRGACRTDMALHPPLSKLTSPIDPNGNGGRNNEEGSWLEMETTVVSQPKVFLDEVRGELPCYAVRKSMGRKLDAMMVDEDCIVGVRDVSFLPSQIGSGTEGLHLYEI